MEELLAKVQGNDTFIKELLADTTYVGEVTDEPFFSTLIRPCYNLHIRPLKDIWLGIDNDAAELVLDTGEIVPIVVIGQRLVHPVPEAVESGYWAPRDEAISIDDTGLTQEQVPLVRWFVQPRILECGK